MFVVVISLPVLVFIGLAAFAAFRVRRFLKRRAPGKTG